LFCEPSICPGACIIKLITTVIYGFHNKLECLSLASVSSLVLCLGTNSMVVINFMIQAPVPFCLARTFLGICQTTLKCLTVFRQVCLNAQIIRGLFNETLKTCNLRQIDRSLCKLVCFILSVTNILARTSTLAYNRIRTLTICIFIIHARGLLKLAFGR